MTEKETVEKILRSRGVIENGVFNEVKFRKFVTEPWIHAKTYKYGFDKLGAKAAEKVAEQPENVCPKCGKNPCECEHEAVVEEAPVVEEVVETVAEQLEEQLPEEQQAEEPAVEEVTETVAEEPVTEEVETEEAPAEVIEEAPKKKSSKKKA